MIQAVPTLAAASTASATDARQAKLKSAAQAFEAVFVRQMISSMRQAGLSDGMFDSEATNQFQDMADSKTADAVAGHGVLGIAEKLVGQLSPVVPQAAVAGAAVEGVGRLGHVVGDLASRFKL